MAADLERALSVFSKASEYVQASGLQREVDRHRRVSLSLFTETEFLCESAWVILCTGFREAVVRRAFDHISLCFCDWESAWSIVEAHPACHIAARASFRNERKLEAIFNISRHVHRDGFLTVKEAIIRDPIGELQRLPYIGPVTAWHLAKNLGLDAAKPDRHLARAATSLGFGSAHDLCQAIAKSVGEMTKVVDLVLWRYFADMRPSD